MDTLTRKDPSIEKVLVPKRQKLRKDGEGSIDSDGHIKHNVNGKYVLEHRIIAEKALGKPLPASCPVHHFNGDKTDNRNSNLAICQNNAYHALIEKRTRAFKATGNPNSSLCKICGQWKDNSEFPHKWSRCEECRRNRKNPGPTPMPNRVKAKIIRIKKIREHKGSGIEHPCRQCGNLFDARLSQIRKKDFICLSCKNEYNRGWAEKRRMGGEN